MKDLFVSFEIAKQLKEKGFNEPCICYGCRPEDIMNCVSVLGMTNKNLKEKGYHSDWLTFPLYQQVVDWFREKHNYVISIRKNKSGNYYSVVSGDGYERFDLTFNGNYYQALDNGIEKALELI